MHLVHQGMQCSSRVTTTNHKVWNQQFRKEVIKVANMFVNFKRDSHLDYTYSCCVCVSLSAAMKY